MPNRRQGGAEPDSPADHSACSERLLAAAVEEIRGRRSAPGATYRLQLHAGFTFREPPRSCPILPSLASPTAMRRPISRPRRAATTATTSPIHAAQPRDRHRRRPRGLADAIKQHGLGLVLDVVPNHMGIMGNQNPWWNDVLENGQASRYARYFDIDWSAPTRAENQGRVLLPMLGDLYGVVLEKGELRVGTRGRHVPRPVPRSSVPAGPQELSPRPRAGPSVPRQELGAEHEAALELQSVLTTIGTCPSTRKAAPSTSSRGNARKR